MPKRHSVLITGASGFVGSAVVRAALTAGYAVRALVRESSSRANLEDLDVEIAEGDVLDADAVSRAMRGVRFVVHCAADYRLWVRDRDALVATNVAGTRNVMRAALAIGAERIVHTSSVATLAAPADERPSDETRRLDPSAAVGAYKRSKVLAEREVERFIERDRLPAVIVLPSTPVGPRDLKPTPTGRVIVEAAAGRMPAFVDTGLNLVHVDDVAKGHIAALERGAVGERYILGGQNVSLREMLGEIARLAGRRPPRVQLPRPLLYPFAIVAEGIAATTNRTPFLTRDGLRMARYRMFFSSAKAERDLGYQARPYRDAVAEAIAWFRAAGYLT
jgi:dihydroflavonol-4-reductase